MQIPLQFTLRDMPSSPAVEAAVREKAEKLELFFDRITSCRVLIEAAHRHRHKGNLYHVRIDITVPGNEIVVKRDPAEHAEHEDIYVAIRDAFDAARRQLQTFSARRRGEVKPHPVPITARVLRLFPAQGYGFLGTHDGREVYFHRNSLVDLDFDHLDSGTEVNFIEEQGHDGPQAAYVTPARLRTGE